jgi:hypothetical protein
MLASLHTVLTLTSAPLMCISPNYICTWKLQFLSPQPPPHRPTYPIISYPILYPHAFLPPPSNRPPPLQPPLHLPISIIYCTPSPITAHSSRLQVLPRLLLLSVFSSCQSVLTLKSKLLLKPPIYTPAQVLLNRPNIVILAIAAISIWCSSKSNHPTNYPRTQDNYLFNQANHNTSFFSVVPRHIVQPIIYDSFSASYQSAPRSSATNRRLSSQKKFELFPYNTVPSFITISLRSYLYYALFRMLTRSFHPVLEHCSTD